MNDTLRAEINKRLTLNWLIQGAAQHAGMTFHHVVRDELEAIDPEWIALYDEYALINLLQYWSFDALLLFGWPARFWRRAETRQRHPFFEHPILSRHGGALAASARERGVQRCKEKGFWWLRYCFSLGAVYAIDRLRVKEARHSVQLAALAKRAVSTVWGIATDKLEAELTTKVAFGNLSQPKGSVGRTMRTCAVGYGGVLRRGNRFVVVGRGTNWQLTAKELVKGTAELICLHGLNQLSDDVYGQVIAAADGPDLEPWMLQTGGELWRHLLAVIPQDRPLAEILMHIARLPARSLEVLILAVLEDPPWASELLARLGAAEDERSAAADVRGTDLG